MRTFILIIVLRALGACGNKDRSSQQNADTLVRGAHISADTSGYFRGKPLQNEILEQMQQINRLLIKDSVRLENEELAEDGTDGGAMLTGYFFNNELAKLAEWAGLSYGVVEREFYFSHDSLIGVTVKESYFPVDSSGTDPSRFEGYFTGNYLFAANKCIDKTTHGEKRFEERENYEADYPETAAALKSFILKKKRPE